MENRREKPVKENIHPSIITISVFLPARQAVGFCECRHYIGKHIHLITYRRCSCRQTDAVPVNGENVFRIKNVKFQKKC